MELFTDSDKYYKLSHIGWGNTNQQFSGYIRGYKKAGDELVEKAIISNDITTLDIFVYPILFLYRQYIELQLKNVFLQYSDTSKEEKEQFLRQTNHNLKAIFVELKPILEQCIVTKDDEHKFEDIENTVIEYDKFDKSSFSFRYPINKDLTKIPIKNRRIDLEVLKNHIESFHKFFIGITSMLEEKKQFERDVDY